MAAAVVSISDELLSQQLDLLRFEASTRRDVLAQLAQLQAELVSRLAQEGDVTSFTKARLRSLLAQTDQVISSYYGALGDQLDASLTSMAELTAAHAANAMETYFLGGVDVAVPTDTFLARLTGNALVQGAASADWWAKQGEDVQFRFATAVRQGAAAGDTLGGIVARVRDVMDIGRSNARSLVHTSIMEVSAEARKEVYQQNSDVVEGTVQLSTLDSHTTDICMAYSGAEYDLEGNPIGDTRLPYDGGVPRHWGCRSIEVPITKTFAELGIDAPEPPPGERASADGPVPADITFDDFLTRMGKDFQDETLGAGRAELWRKGDITLPQLLDLRGQPLTLDELRAKYESGIAAGGAMVGAAGTAESARAVREAALATASELGFDTSQLVFSDEVQNFDVGGITFGKGGEADIFGSGKVTIFQNVLTPETAPGLVAHEVEHVQYQQVLNEYYDERRGVIADDRQGTLPSGRTIDGVILADGQLLPEFIADYPVYAALQPLDELRSAELIAEDGVTEYSKAYWTEYTAHRGGVTRASAMQETMAEIASLRQRGITGGVSDVWNEYFDTVQKLYEERSSW